MPPQPRLALIATVIYRQNRFAQTKQSLFAASLLRVYLDRPYSFHLNHNSAVLLNKIVTATPLLFLGALLPFLEMTLELLRSAGTLAVLFATDFWATLGTALALKPAWPSWYLASSKSPSAIACSRSTGRPHVCAASTNARPIST